MVYLKSFRQIHLWLSGGSPIFFQKTFMKSGIRKFLDTFMTSQNASLMTLLIKNHFKDETVGHVNVYFLDQQGKMVPTYFCFKIHISTLYIFMQKCQVTERDRHLAKPFSCDQFQFCVIYLYKFKFA